MSCLSVLALKRPDWDCDPEAGGSAAVVAGEKGLSVLMGVIDGLTPPVAEMGDRGDFCNAGIISSLPNKSAVVAAKPVPIVGP